MARENSTVPTTRRAVLRLFSALGVSATVTAGNVGANSDDGSVTTLQLPREPYLTVAHGATYFRGTNGWAHTSDADKVRAIRGLHTDFLDFRRLVWVDGSDVGFPPGVRNQIEFSKGERLPATTAQTIYIRTDEQAVRERYGWLQSQRGWRFPDGEPVDSAVDLLGEQFSGTVHGYDVQESGVGIPSVFAPGTLDILTREAEVALGRGFVSMFVDSVTTPRLMGLDFSPWAQAAFREHLAEADEDRLAELGVTNPSTLDVREAFRERGVEPGETDTPADDPLFREYLRFHHRGMKELTRRYQAYLQGRFPERAANRGATLNANHFVGDSFGNDPVAAVYTSDHMDYITIEDNRTKPPGAVRELVYKLAWAMSRNEKPALVEGQMQNIPGNDSTRGLDLDRDYVTLRRLQFAEAYANAVPRKIPLTGWGNVDIDDTITHWIQADGSVIEPLQRLADFLWINQRFLRGATPDNDVALVFSMPTMLWHRLPQWGRVAKRRRRAFRGAAAVLREAQIPYDVAIFGHHDLWDDTWQLERLSNYEAVVLPEVDCLSRPQAEAIDGLLDDGVRIVTTGEQPARTADYEPTSFSWLDRDGVVAIEESPLVGSHELVGSHDVYGEDHQLSTVLADVSSVRVDANYPLAVNRLRNMDLVQVHLVNYAYDETDDTVEPVTDVAVTVDDVPAGPARFISPGQELTLDVGRFDGASRVHVPSVQEWGFVVFAEEPSALEPEASEATAREALTDARAQYEGTNVYEPETQARVETFIDEASLAFDAGAFDLVLERADRIRAALRGAGSEAEELAIIGGLAALGAGGLLWRYQRRRNQ